MPAPISWVGGLRVSAPGKRNPNVLPDSFDTRILFNVLNKMRREFLYLTTPFGNVRVMKQHRAEIRL